MYRITDPAKSRAFYEALGFTASHESPIVRNGELEATNYFFSLGDAKDVLELTFNHDGRTYDNGTEKPPYQVREGGSRLCFVRDPDDYRIELIERR
jgi:lactoylglutathione lyase